MFELWCNWRIFKRWRNFVCWWRAIIVCQSRTTLMIIISWVSSFQLSRHWLWDIYWDVGCGFSTFLLIKVFKLFDAFNLFFSEKKHLFDNSHVISDTKHDMKKDEVSHGSQERGERGRQVMLLIWRHRHQQQDTAPSLTVTPLSPSITSSTDTTIHITYGHRKPLQSYPFMPVKTTSWPWGWSVSAQRAKAIGAIAAPNKYWPLWKS